MPLRIARPNWMSSSATLKKMSPACASTLERAKAAGADLVVFPELERSAAIRRVTF